MKKELDQALVKDFPLTFRDRHGDMRSTCMVWGFPGNGWEPLIRKAAEKIEPRIQQLIDEGRESEDVRFTSTQVKEKFGTLHWYFSFSDDVIDAAIKEAEETSHYVCELCGAEGEARNTSWVLTLCDECHEKRLQDRTRDHLIYLIRQELNKQGMLDAVSHLETWWKEKKKEKEDEQDY